MCTSHVHFTALHCDMCNICNMCNMCYMCNMCNAFLHCTLFHFSALHFTALHCIAACVLHCALNYNGVHCRTALLCCSRLRSRCSTLGQSWLRACLSKIPVSPGHPRLPYTPPLSLPTTAEQPSNHIYCTHSFLKSYGLVSVPLTL